jgi:hypothetical protein
MQLKFSLFSGFLELVIAHSIETAQYSTQIGKTFSAIQAQ